MKSACFVGSLKFLSALAVLVAAILLLSGCALLPTEREPLPPPLVEPPRMRFNTHAVTRSDIVHQVMGAGTFVPLREYNLSFLNNAGRLSSFMGEPGMNVTQGQILAELETEQLEFDISQMNIELKKLELIRDRMNMEYNRLIESRNGLKEAVDTYGNSDDKRALAETNHNISRHQIDLEIHNLNISQQAMHIERASKRIEAARIKSPIDGVIVAAYRMAIGDWVNAYHVLFTVADPSVLLLRFNPTVMTGFEVGMDVIVEIDRVDFAGKIVMTPRNRDEILPNDLRFENSIIVEVTDKPSGVEPGDNASIRVIFQEKNDVLVIPRSGLRTVGQRNYVIVRRDEINREVDVEIGVQTPTSVEIVAGLSEGEEIILR